MIKNGYQRYVVGFLLSLAITLITYLIATMYTGALHGGMVAVLVGLAVTQIMLQLFFFLHLYDESSPRWNLIAFITMVMVVLFIVVGSIWIMNNLDYNMMPNHNPEIEHEMMVDEGISR